MNFNELTEVRPSPLHGNGLFTRVNVPRNQLIVTMDHPRRMKRSEIGQYFDEHYPNLHDKINGDMVPRTDIIIHEARSCLVFYDASFDTFEAVPHWYNLNHSKNPNTKPVVINPHANPRDKKIGWVTIKAVPANAELTFTYENVPPEWDIYC